jgi:hypothetical protein
VPRHRTAAGIVVLLAFALPTVAAERINQEGRILGPAPTVSAPILFNTAGADAVVAAMQIFPVTSAWNEDISGRPLLANSAAMIAKIKADLSASRQTLRLFTEMNYVLVPDSQAKVDVLLVDYPDESDDIKAGTTDIASLPVPSTMPVETWPVGTGSLTLEQWQRDENDDGGDRHAIVVMPGAGFIWEMWQARLTTNTPAWQASNDAKFDLKSNTLRPAGWTSGDAAGLPMFGALVRYDECERGMVEHAMRIVVGASRREYIYPATHQAGSTTDANTPAMGQRVRLKASFAIPGTWTKQEKAVALALKKYGAIVADNGGFFSISICPDNRFPSGCFDRINTLAIDQFEVIQTTGATEGPRSAGAPTASAGPDQTVTVSAGADLAGSVTGSGLTVSWVAYGGPGTVTFANAAAAATHASFSAPGAYTLRLGAADGVHAVAYDACVVTVNASGPGPMQVTPAGGLLASGTAGGPFTPASASYTVSNPGTSAMSWTARAQTGWVTVSPSGGSLAAGASTTVTVSIAGAEANALPGAETPYADTVLFRNTSNGTGSTTRSVRLAVAGAAELAVEPTGPFVVSGRTGGPFSPSSQAWTLTNAGAASLNWTASCTQGWLAVSPGSGTLAPGASATVTATVVAAAANLLAAGTYADVVSITNASGGSGTTKRWVTLTASADAPPTLTVSTPPATVTASPLVVTGTVTDTGGVTTVTWSNAATGESGTGSLGGGGWSATVPLTPGANPVTITTFDTLGNGSTVTFTVTYAPSAEGGGGGGGGDDGGGGGGCFAAAGGGGGCAAGMALAAAVLAMLGARRRP